jgi:hypothetical protein
MFIAYNKMLERFNEAIDTSRVVMVAQVKDLLSLYNLLDKLMAYVKCGHKTNRGRELKE